MGRTRDLLFVSQTTRGKGDHLSITGIFFWRGGVPKSKGKGEILTNTCMGISVRGGLVTWVEKLSLKK